MPEQWIVRVGEKEYGPVDLATLHEWRSEGRVIPANEVREADSETWRRAAEVPGLFAQAPAAQGAPQIRIGAETFVIYRRGFFKFLGLVLLVTGPAIIGQIVSAILGRTVAGDFRLLLESLVSFCMMMLTLVLTPVYIAGIQLLTAELHLGRTISFHTLLNDAVRFWPRVCFLWLFVFICYAFWTVLPVGIILALLSGGPSLPTIFLVLALLSLQVWMTGRLFINFLFWQQFAVLDACDATEALRRSKELARSRGDLAWFRRPMWRGVFMASLWFVFVLALNWPEMAAFYHASLATLTTPADAQTMVDQVSKTLEASGGRVGFVTGLLQAILKPLLGIAFVLLYFDCKRENL